MGHILLNWCYYSHLQLQLVTSNLTTYLTLTLSFLMFLKSSYEMIPSLWLSWLLLRVFGSSIYFITIPSKRISCKKCCHLPHPNWKRSKRWHHRKLHYWLICCCRRQPIHHTHLLDISFLPYLTVLSIGTGGGGEHMLGNYLRIFGWMNF